MKKLLTSILIISCLAGKGQMKIGNITVSDSIAKKYLHNCYNHPDTFSYMKSTSQIMVESSSNGSYNYQVTPSMQEYGKKAEEFNEWLNKNKSGRKKDGKYLVP